MDKENMEWPEDGKLLAKVGNNNPFAVPAGYFEGLGERIVAAVKIDEIKNTISDVDFTVPDNYFENLSSNILSRIAVEDILNKDAGFEVPVDYFENLAGNIQSRIAVEEALDMDAGFEVPADYFEDLSSRIQSRLFVEEALTVADAFIVPENYFEQLNTEILNKTVKQDVVKRKGTVIQMIRSSAFKYATAACFVLVVGASFFLWPSSQDVDAHQSTYLHQQLSGISAEDIQGYVEMNVDASDAQHTLATQDVPLNDEQLEAALANYVEKAK